MTSRGQDRETVIQNILMNGGFREEHSPEAESKL